MPPKIWNPYRSRLETEKVYGEGAVRLLYDSVWGKAVRPLLTRSKVVSQAYGWLQSSPLSQKKIAPFVEAFQINMKEFEETSFRTFNDFFIRKFKPGQRPFVEEPSTLPAPCEARYLFYTRVDDTSRVPVKGALLNPSRILESSSYARRFVGGAMAIARLCPVDYHRFHFPDDCRILESVRSLGRLESVNPLSVAGVERLFCDNERMITVLETKNFGLCAMVEVGALCVGKIKQSYDSNKETFQRGEEKGYFLFGGSTVLLFFEPERIKWRSEYLAKSNEGTEVFVKLGDALGLKAV